MHRFIGRSVYSQGRFAINIFMNINMIKQAIKGGILISYLINAVGKYNITLFFFKTFDICLFHVVKLHLGDVKFCEKKQYSSCFLCNPVIYKIHLITKASG